ncbi:MAG: DNA repair protein RadC [Bacteroidaceae bacterium]|nr:DNA repair protein RadC [Bacteroidaceae bacterium]
MINKNFQPFNTDSIYTGKEPLEGNNSKRKRRSDTLCSRAKEPPLAGNDTASPLEEQQTFTPIKEWAEEDRPREKLMAKGPEALTNAELLAILIGNGTAKMSAVDLMREVLNSCGGTLRNLNRLTLQDLMRFNGIGEAKALTIIAASEIGKRRMMESGKDIQQFRSGDDVFRYMRSMVQDLEHEESWVLLLNNNTRLINCIKLSSGGLTETAVDVRMLLKQAIIHDATCFILVHNHPSGNMRPSNADDDLTRRVREASRAVNMRMLDHVIVSEDDYYSYAENGKL